MQRGALRIAGRRHSTAAPRPTAASVAAVSVCHSWLDGRGGFGASSSFDG
jgi:hypothetical protein